MLPYSKEDLTYEIHLFIVPLTTRLPFYISAKQQIIFDKPSC